MGLLLGISKDDIANFTVAKPDGMGGYIYNTFLVTLGDDTWDCHVNAKKMQEWIQAPKKGKVHIVITNTERITYSDVLFGSYHVGADETINAPAPGHGGTPRYPGDTGGAATLDQPPVTTRDSLVDYERPNINFKSLLCTVTRNKIDAGFNSSDYRAQAVSATKYPQSLFLFEDATGCTGVFFGASTPPGGGAAGPHDFRNVHFFGLDGFGVLVDTGDPNAPNRFLWPSSTTRTYNIPVTITTNWVWPGTDLDDPANNVATASRITGFHTLHLVLSEEFA